MSWPLVAILSGEDDMDAQTAGMTPTLEDKLAAMVWYMEEIRSNRRGTDRIALSSYLDDPEIAAWLDKMNKAGRIKNTRFTLKT